MKLRSVLGQAPRRLIWLGILLLLLLLFAAGRGNQAAMTWLVDHVTQPVKHALGAVTYLVPFPLAELLYVAFGLWIAVFLVRSVLLVRRSGRRRQTAFRRILTLLCVVLTALDWFCLAWGVNYYADGFQERSGIYGQPVSADELYRVMDYFTRQVNAAAREVPRDENGCFQVGRDEIFAASTEIYANSYEEFPFLEQEDRTPKRMLLSKLLYYLGS